MKSVCSKYFVFICLGLCLNRSALLAATVGADFLSAKREAEGKGYTFETSHDEIVAKAKKEGKLRVLSSLNPDAFNQILTAFKHKYPNIDAQAEEITGTDAAQRFLLQVKAGAVKEWDVFHLTIDFYNESAVYAKKFDVLGMAGAGILSIPILMVDPKNRNVVGSGSGISVIAYNQKLISADKVPNRWEDFLKPEFKGRKFIVEIRPVGFAAMAAGLGEEWVKDYARKIKEQEPVWSQGQTRGLSSMIAGEHALHQQVNYHSCVGAQRKDVTKSLVCKVIEPVPVRISEREAVLETAAHPYAALLWLEFLATPTAQKLIDDYEPKQASIYTQGSELERVTRGKKLSVNSWDTFHMSPHWYQMVVEAFGFPRADIGGK